MAAIVRALKLGVRATFKDFEYGDPWLENLGDVNFFIGPNSSGKSRFLRALFLHIALPYRPGRFDLTEVCQNLAEYKKFLLETLGGYSSRRLGEIDPDKLSTWETLDELGADGKDQYTSLLTLIRKFSENTSLELFRGNSSTSANAYQNINEMMKKRSREFLEVLERNDLERNRVSQHF